MNELSKSKIQMFCVWCFVIYLVMLFAGWALAGLFPPLPPGLGASQIADHFASNPTRVRLGVVIIAFSAVIIFPFMALWAQFISRIEGGIGPLTLVSVMGGASWGLITYFPAQLWLTAAFRPNRSDELVQLLNDMAYLPFILGISVALVPSLCFVVAVFCDQRAEPLFPRWVAYANLFVILTWLPDQAAYWFHRGLFAWNGLFALYLPGLIAVSVIGGVNLVYMRRIILRDRAALLVDPVEEPIA